MLSLNQTQMRCQSEVLPLKVNQLALALEMLLQGTLPSKFAGSAEQVLPWPQVHLPWMHWAC